jgi:hypothetical protein
MNTLVIKDLHEGVSDVRELNGKEMENIKGGAGPDIGGYDTLHSVVHEITKSIDVGAAIRNGHW